MSANPGVVPVAATVFGEEIRTRDAEELRYRITGAIAERYAAQHGIAVTAAEKEAYARKMQTLRSRDRAEVRARRDDLQAKLAAGGLAVPERERFAADLDGANRHLATLDEMESDAKRNPEETRVARDMIADAIIGQWKVNQALYRHYGGRIVYQQGGPEPLDAWRLFLEEGQTRGDFAIRDAGLERAFWRYYTDDATHSFYPKGSREQQEAFVIAPWERGTDLAR